MAAIQFGDYVSGQYMLVGYMYPVVFLQLATAGLIGVFPLASGGVSLLAMGLHKHSRIRLRWDIRGLRLLRDLD